MDYNQKIKETVSAKDAYYLKHQAIIDGYLHFVELHGKLLHDARKEHAKTVVVTEKKKIPYQPFYPTKIFI